MGNNVSIPHSGFIQGGIKYGSHVLISGMPLHHCKQFSINLCTGPNCDSDTAFHFNPRFDEGQVVRNHKQGGTWGMEERNGGMPFTKGQHFEIQMKVEQQGYKVTINNKHFCTFHHRIPKEGVGYLNIAGDVAINFIQSKGQGSYPTGNVAPPPYPGLPSYPSYPGAGYNPAASSYPGAAYSPPVSSYPTYPTPQAGPLYSPPVPLVTPIPGGLYPGKIIFISGMPNYNPARFTVNLACGATDSADIALHFDVRFNFGSSKSVVVRTQKEKNSYGQEERHQSYFPFYPGANFDMMILAEASCYKIAVNNQHYTEFNHRIHPLQKVNYLNISGDVQLTQVRFQ